jgi:transposase-like protein
MLHTTDILCSHCGGNNLQKNGKSITGTQRWYCKVCKKYFQREYRYNAYSYGVKEKIIEMTLNCSGARDIGRVLKINKNTVIAVLKKNAKS